MGTEPRQKKQVWVGILLMMMNTWILKKQKSLTMHKRSKYVQAKMMRNRCIGRFKHFTASFKWVTASLLVFLYPFWTLSSKSANLVLFLLFFDPAGTQWLITSSCIVFHLAGLLISPGWMTIQTATISVVGSFATKSEIIWAIFCNNWNDFLINTYISSTFPHLHRQQSY